ncbi:MAG: Stk1 family PASTA domain-containing Ser/Thr kinase [Pseudonocardiaceae bacterium]
MEPRGPERDGNLVGSLLDGRYRVGPVLARGGMSTVYRGTDTRLERPVAIKVMAPRFAADPVFLQRFEREARAAARLHHPGVVGVHDQGADSSPAGDYVFLVMELVDGGTLRDLLRQHGRLSVTLALSVTEMVLSALAAAHREGLVHRDVKPENVLIGPGGIVKVADFGLVRAVAEASSSTGDVILGTVAYLSPEQVATGAADARSDVYATGVMLFEMLTGAPPYTGETALSVAYRHVNDDMPAPSAAGAAVPAPLDELIVRATRRDPESRPPNAAAFLHALNAVRAEVGLPRVRVPVPAARSASATQAISPEHGPGGTRALARTERAPQHDPYPHDPYPHDPYPRDPYPRERARNRRAFIAWMTIVLLLASAIGLGAWWLGSGRWTAVPNLTGLQRGAVTTALAAADLTADLKEDHNNTAPNNTVISTDPASGHRVLRGSEITVLISLGRPVVPTLEVGSTTEDAERAIQQAELSPRLDPRAAVFDDTVPAGAVIGSRPAAGTMLTIGAPVTVVISKGPAPIPMTIVPQVVGLSVAQARQALANAGLNSTISKSLGGFSGGPFDGFGFLEGFPDRVISQSPPAGQSVRSGATVSLTAL